MLKMNGHVLLLNGDSTNEDDQITFQTVQECYEITGISGSLATQLNNVDSMNYEPGKGLHISFTDGVKANYPVPFQPWEDLLSNIPAYKIIQDDPYYGMDLDAAKQYRIDEVISLAKMHKRNVFESGSNKLSPDGLQTLEDIQTQVLLAGVAQDGSWSMDVIMDDTNPDGSAVRMTLTALQLLPFLRNLWARNESINQIAQDNIDAINALTTIQNVKDYVITQ